MKQFVITIPNPIRGKGARGFDRRPKRGEATFSIFHCYAKTEKRAREITAKYLEMRKVPDGTRLVEIVNDPRVKREKFIDLQAAAAPTTTAVAIAAPKVKTFELVNTSRSVQQDTHVYEIDAVTEEEAREIYNNFIERGATENIRLTDSYSYYTDQEVPVVTISELITDEQD